MGLFGPAWKSKNEAKALACTKAEQNELTLREIAEKAPLPRVRSCAVRKLHGAGTLLRLSQTEEDASTLAVLRERLHDNEELLAILMSRMERKETKRRALCFIDDERLLLQLIRKCDDRELCALAAGKIVTGKNLLEAAKTEPSAAERLRKTEDIISVLRETTDDLVQDVLFLKLTESAAFITLAAEAKSAQVRKRASSYLTDERVLAELIVKDPKKFGHFLDRIKSEELLLQVERHTDNELLLREIYRLQGVYLCPTCGKKTAVTSCICQHCGAESHDYRFISDVCEHRDYATGTEYEQCTRCGKKINERSVYHEYLE